MKSKIIPLAAIVITATAAGGWFHYHDNRPETELTLQGNVDIRQVDLAFNASGRIAKILVREGDSVKAGQLLASLDTERLQLSLTQLEAQTSAQRDVLARYQAGSRPEEIRQARAQRDAALATTADAKAYYQRQVDLVARHFVSQQQADSAKFALDKAEAQLHAAEQTLRLAELGPRREDIATAKANLNAGVAAEAVMRHDIQEGELHAPSDGVIENRILEPGDMASPQKPVFTLALTEPVWVRAYLSETDLGRVSAGARALIHTDDGKSINGWVGYISPNAEFTPKAVETTEIRASLVYQTRVYVCGNGDGLRQGMPATITIPLHQAPRAPKADPCRD